MKNTTIFLAAHRMAWFGGGDMNEMPSQADAIKVASNQPGECFPSFTRRFAPATPVLVGTSFDP